MGWWSNVDWGSVAGATASYFAADKAADAAKTAGNQSAAGSEASNALLREFYNRDEARNQGAFQDGEAARGQFMRMLGMTPSGATQNPQTSTGGYGAQNYSLVEEGPDGMPKPNDQLYATNPEYRQAWDATLQRHRQQWKGNGYHAGSDNEWIRSGIAQRFQMPQQGMQMSGNTPPQLAPGQQPAQSQSQLYDLWRGTPGYQFGLDEGNKSIEASAAARGGLNSGATLKALQKHGTDYADQQGFTPYMNRLASVAGMGQTASSAMGAAGQNYGGAMAGNLVNAGNARAQSTYAAGQARQDGYANLAYFGGKAYDSWRGGR